MYTHVMFVFLRVFVLLLLSERIIIIIEYCFYTSLSFRLAGETSAACTTNGYSLYAYITWIGFLLAKNPFGKAVERVSTIAGRISYTYKGTKNRVCLCVPVQVSRVGFAANQVFRFFYCSKYRRKIDGKYRFASGQRFCVQINDTA